MSYSALLSLVGLVQVSEATLSFGFTGTFIYCLLLLAGFDRKSMWKTNMR